MVSHVGDFTKILALNLYST